MNPFHQRVYDQLRGVANGMTLELITSRLGEAKSPVRTALQALQEAGHVTLKGKRWFDADAAQVGDVAGADSEAAPTAEVPAVDGGAAASDADAALPSPPTPTAARPEPVDPTAERAADAVRALGLEPTIGDVDPTTGTRSVTYRLPPMEAPAGSDAEQDDTPDAVSHDEASGATASNDEMFDDMARELGMLKSSLRRSRLTLSLWQSGTHMVDPCHIARLANEDGERPDAYLRAVAHRLCLAADQLELAADVAKIAWLGKKAEPPPGDLATAAAAQAAGL